MNMFKYYIVKPKLIVIKTVLFCHNILLDNAAYITLIVNIIEALLNVVLYTCLQRILVFYFTII